jgi:hypothetical protein
MPIAPRFFTCYLLHHRRDVLPKIGGTAEYGWGHDGPRKMVTVGRGGSGCLGIFRWEPLGYTPYLIIYWNPPTVLASAISLSLYRLPTLLRVPVSSCL